MSHDETDKPAGGMAPPDARLLSLAALTEPTDAEVHRVLAGRVTRQDATRLDDLANLTQASWVEEARLRSHVHSLGPPAADPRTRTWARVTEPTARELARVTTVPVPAAVSEATEPSPAEVRAVIEGRMPPVWRTLTEPTEDEVQRLLRRRAELVQSPSGRRIPPGLISGLGWAAAAGGAAAAALVVFGVWTASTAPGYGTPDLAPGQLATLEPAQLIELGPSIDMQPHAFALASASAPAEAHATVRVAEAGIEGTVVDLIEGGTRFEVDPRGAHRHLTVRARDVEVVVKGTVFTVDSLPDAVVVGVERGKVQVSSPSGTIFLTTGQTWRSDTGHIATADAEPGPALGSPSHDGMTDGVDDGVADDPALLPDEPDLSEDAPEPGSASVAAPVVAVAPAAPPMMAAPRVAPLVGTADAPASPAVAAPQAPAEKDETARTTAQTRQASAEAGTADDADARDWPPTRSEARPERLEPAEDVQAEQAEAEAKAMALRAEDLQGGLSELSDIRRRHSAGEDPKTLIGELELFVYQDPPEQLVGVAQGLRVDIARSVDNPAYFDEAARATHRRSPSDPSAALLQLEAGHRFIQAQRYSDAVQAFGRATDMDGDLGVRALTGQAQAYFMAGDDRKARLTMDEAIRRVSDPALEDELEAIRDQLRR